MGGGGGVRGGREKTFGDILKDYSESKGRSAFDYDSNAYVSVNMSFL